MSYGFGKTFERYEIGADERVTAYFTDGNVRDRRCADSAPTGPIRGYDSSCFRTRSGSTPAFLAVAGKHRLNGAKPASQPARGRQYGRPGR
jgi:hypothetical protein